MRGESGRTSHPTCRSELNLDLSSTGGGAQAAGVFSLITAPHTSQQQRDVSCGHSVRKQLSPASELRRLSTELWSSILIQVNLQLLLLPGKRHVTQSVLLKFFGKIAAEEHVLTKVCDGFSVAAHQLRCRFYKMSTSLVETKAFGNDTIPVYSLGCFKG